MNIQSLGRWVTARIGHDSTIVRVLRPAYEHVLFVLSGGRGILWTVNGAEYRIDPRRRHQFGPDYEAPVAEYLRQRIVPGQVCYDVGANIGVYVLQLSRWVGPTGKVVAFEPNPEARSALERHIKWNSLTGRVRVVPAAVSDTEGQGELHAAGADGMSRLDAPNVQLEGRAHPVPVQLTSLDAFSSRGDWPDWIIVDVEGYELSVLRGARRLITGPRRQPRLVVEMHPSEWHRLGESSETARTLLRDLGLHPIPLTGQADALSEYGIVALEPS